MLSFYVKWAGGKAWLADRLVELQQRHRKARLVESFAGGLALARAVEAAAVVANDSNPALINYYIQLRRGLRNVAADGSEIVLLRNDRETFLRNRERYNALLAAGAVNNAEFALLFFYINRTAFNGLHRVNRRGVFNVGFGTYSHIDYAGMMADFPRIQQQIQGWRFLCRDFAKIPLLANDFLFVDPPYDGCFVGYSPNGFTWADQVRLVEWAAAHRGPVVACNSNTPRVVELWQSKGFHVEFVAAPRNINCNGTGRQPVLEMLAMRNV